MLPVIVIAASVVADGSVSLDDARAFRMEPEVCRQFWRMARDHRQVMRITVEANNSPDVVDQWEREIEWRARCWFLLDDVLYMDNLTPTQKLRSLAELKELIGERWYYGGRMPDPFPSYRIPEWTVTGK